MSVHKKKVSDMNRIYLAILLLLIFSLNLFSQTKIDSLETQLKIVKGEEKIEVLNELVTAYDAVSYTKSLDYAIQALELTKKFKSKENIADISDRIGRIYFYLDNYDKSIEYFLNSLKTRENIGNKTGVCQSYNNIGVIYLNIGNYEKALEYLLNSLKISEDISDKDLKSKNLVNLGIAYMQLDNYDKALEYYQKALTIYKETDNKKAVAGCLNNIGINYWYLDNFNESLEFYLKALKLKEEIGDTWGISNTSINIGQIYVKLKNYNKAFIYINNGLKLAEKIKSRHLLKDSYSKFSELYTEKNDYKKALKYYKLYTEIKDSIFTDESGDKIAEMQTKYETEKKEKENEILKKDNDIQKLEIKKQQNLRNSLVAISILILILAFVIYARYRSKHRTNIILNQKNNLIEKKNKEFNKKNKELEIHEEHISLINNILQHDLTNNLSITSSDIRLFRKSNDMKMIDEILKSTEKSVELIRNMQNLEKFLNLHSALKLYFLNDTIDTIVKNFNTINFNITGRSKVLADDSLSSVFENIIGNAVVHGKPDRIDINIVRKEKICEVRIADNGIGIPEKIRESIFDEGFKYGKEGNTGMGLYIVKKAMQSYGGNISVENNKPKGTIFVLTFRRMG